MTEREVRRLIEASKARSTPAGDRDATMIMLAYRHGLRVSELCGLRWGQVDIEMGSLHINRVKRGSPSVHPMGESEIKALGGLPKRGVYVFTTDRGGPVTPAGFRKMMARLGDAAGFTFPIHPHMLRHACGFKLANDGQDTRAVQAYLGHRNIQHTVRYTELASGRFRGFWDD